jgi:hypothetical protein
MQADPTDGSLVVVVPLSLYWSTSVVEELVVSVPVIAGVEHVVVVNVALTFVALAVDDVGFVGVQLL